jgi:membrane protease YdiL (CAAX protease family)
MLCMIAAYFLHVDRLYFYGGIYFALLITGFVVYYANQDVPEQFFICFILGTLGLFAVSMLITIISRSWGFLMSVPPPAPTTFSTISTQVFITADQLLSFFMNIPGPVAEECGFRIAGIGLLEPALGRIKTVLATATAFGVLHYFAYGGSMVQMVIALVAGIWLGYVYVQYKSRLAIVLSHLTYNIVSLLGFFILGVPLLR